MSSPSGTLSRPSTPHSPSERAALDFIYAVKDAFQGDCPQSDIKYRRFLGVLQDYKDQRIDIKGLTKKCSALLKGHPELIPSFNCFLPLGWTVIFPSIDDSSYPPTLHRRRADARDRMSQKRQTSTRLALAKSLHFMEKVKSRFSEAREEDKYHSLREALRMPLATPQNVQQLCTRVKAILCDHPDLSEEFNDFIPSQEDENLDSCSDNDDTSVEDSQSLESDHPLDQESDNDSFSDTSSTSSFSTSPRSSPTLNSISTPPSSRHTSPLAAKRRRYSTASSELMSLTLDAVVRDPPTETAPKQASPLPFYPTLSVVTPSALHSTKISESLRDPGPSRIEVQFNSTPNIHLRQSREDTSLYQYAPVIYPFNVAVGRKSALEVRNWTWEASDPNPPSPRMAGGRVPSRGLKRALGTLSCSAEEPRRKKQFLRLSGGGSAQGMFGAVGDGRSFR